MLRFIDVDTVEMCEYYMKDVKLRVPHWQPLSKRIVILSDARRQMQDFHTASLPDDQVTTCQPDGRASRLLDFLFLSSFHYAVYYTTDIFSVLTF